jgi:hypothetical protein
VSPVRRGAHDEHRLLPRFRPAAVARSGASPGPVFSTRGDPIAKAPGDAFGLRGIPLMSAQSAGATMPGTQPEEALLAKHQGD